jgi:hypothetical protein
MHRRLWLAGAGRPSMGASQRSKEPAMRTATAPLAATGRRRFIALVGGGAVFTAAPLMGCSSALPDAATAAWRSAAGESDLRRFILAHALLAPNPHNRQPWLADLSVPGRIGLVCDGNRLLPETDPFGRQILIGCGAFVELAVLAARQRGVALEVQPFPDGAPADAAMPAGTRVATLLLGAPGSAEPDPLFAQIVRRHTHKGAYANDRALPAALTAQWLETARSFGLVAGVVPGDGQGEGAMAPIRRLAREAWAIECTTPRTWLESAHLMRIGPAAIARHRDGIGLNATMPRLMHTLGLFDPFEVPQRGSGNFERAMEHWARFESGSGFVWLASSGNSRASQLAAGRAHVRMHLQATAAGAELHPLSQALQEFAEMRGPFDAIHAALGVDAKTTRVQMLSRTGFALEPSGPSPRRGLEALLPA